MLLQQVPAWVEAIVSVVPEFSASVANDCHRRFLPVAVAGDCLTAST